MVSITYLMRQLIDGERDFTLAQSMFHLRMLQNQDDL